MDYVSVRLHDQGKPGQASATSEQMPPPGNGPPRSGSISKWTALVVTETCSGQGHTSWKCSLGTPQAFSIRKSGE